MKRKRRPLMGGKGLVSRVVAGVAAVGLLAASLVAVDLATDAVPASAAPINCTSATQSIINQASVLNTGLTTYSNRLEFFNTETGAITPFVDLSAVSPTEPRDATDQRPWCGRHRHEILLRGLQSGSRRLPEHL